MEIVEQRRVGATEAKERGVRFGLHHVAAQNRQDIQTSSMLKDAEYPLCPTSDLNF